MAKYSQTVSYNLKTTLDASGIAKLQAEIRKTQETLKILSTQSLIGDKQAQEAVQVIEQVQKALKDSFNSRLGMLDLGKFNSSLKDAGLSLTTIQQNMSRAGITGTTTFNSLVGQIGKLDTGLKSTSKTADKLFNTFSNTVRWGVVSSGFNTIMNNANRAVEYVKGLDDSLTQIMLVTDYSRESMNEYAKSANEAAKALGSTTTAMTNASLVFAQQGFNLEESDYLARLSTKLANASQQDTATTSDQITAYMNAYGLDDNMEELSRALDAWAEVANVSAADVSELAEASQKAASTANTVGVSMDQLNGQISAIESVTREAPEQIGNGLKTLYARFSDIAMGETLEDGVNLGEVTSQLEKIGVEVLNGDGQMRGVGDIMEDLMEVWTSLDNTQKAAVAQTLAGKYQLSRFEALMNRSDLYEEYKAASENSEGTLDVMNDKYIDSLEGRLNQLQATLEDVFGSLFDTDDFYVFIDGLTTIVDLFDTLIDSIGGGGAALTAFGSIATKVFSQNLARNINGLLQNREVDITKDKKRALAASQLQEMGLNDIADADSSSILHFAQNLNSNSSILDENQLKQGNTLLQQMVDTTNQLAIAENNVEAAVAATNAAYRIQLNQKEDVVQVQRDKQGRAIGIEDTGLVDFERGVGNDGLLTAKQVQEKVSEYQHVMSAIAGINENLDKTRSSLKQTEDAQQDLNSDSSRYLDNMLDAGTAVEKLQQILGKTSKTGQELGQIFEDLFSTSVDEVNASNFEVISEKLAALEKKATAVGQAYQQLYENADKVLLHGTVDIEKNNSNLVIAKDAQEGAQQAGNDFNIGVDRQKQIQSIINMTSAIGDLTFAWQSFQSLGSLWANDDLTTGEKVLQTLTNLGMTLPMLINGITTLQESTKKLQIGEKIAQIFQKLDGSFVKTAASSAASSTALTAVGGASVTAAAGTTTLTGALRGLLTALGPIGIALGVASAALTVFGFVSEQESQRLQEISDNATEAKSNLESLSSARENFDNIYESYQKGEASSNDLKSAAESLNEILDNQSLKTAIAAENWNLYANSLDNATKAALKKDIAAIQTEQDTIEQDANGAINFVNGNRANNRRGYTNSTQQIIDGNDTKLGSTANDFLASILSTNADGMSELMFDSKYNEVRVNKDLNFEQAIEQLTNFVDAVNSNESLMANLTADQKEQLDKYVESVNRQLNDEDAQTYIANEELLGSSYAQLYGNDSDFAIKEGQSIDEYTQQVKEELAKKGIDASDTLIQAFVEGMAQGDTENSERVANALGKESAVEAWGQGIDSDNVNSTVEQLTDVGITDEELITLQASIDYDTVAKNINEIIDRLNAGDSIEDIIADLQVETDNDQIEKVFQEINGIWDSDTITSRMKNIGIEEGEFDDYRDSLKASNKEYKNLCKEIENTNAELQDQNKQYRAAMRGMDQYSDSAKDLQKKIDANNKAIEENNQMLDSVAAKILETEAGLTELGKSFEDNVESLNNSVKGSQEYTDTINGMSDSISKILNIDMSTWSQEQRNSFIDNKNNLELLKQALNGNVEALQQYRNSAAEQILIKAGLDPNTDAEVFEHMSNLIAYANAFLPLIEAGAEINDEQFYSQLNAMIVSAYEAGAEMSNIMDMLSAMGIEANVKMVNKPYSAVIDVPTYTARGAGTDSTAGLQQEKLATKAYMRQQKLNGNMLVPEITYAKKTGGGTSGRSYTGGGGSGGSGGKGDSGGGSGSGSGTKYEAPENKEIENEIDRYERVQTMLDATAADYDKIANSQDRLIGDELADNMREQIQLLQRQIELYNEKLKIQKEEAKELQNQLSSQYGITFDSEGFISNYATIHQQLIDEVNRLGSQYSSLTSEEAEEALNNQYEAAEKRLEEFEEKYQRYDELWSSDMKDSITQIEDLQDAIEDLRIEAFNTAIEALDNIKDIQEALVEFNHAFHREVEDNPFDAVKDSVLQLRNYFDVATDSVDEYYNNLIRKQQEFLKSSTTQAQKNFYQNQIDQLNAAKAAAGNQSVESMGTGYLDMSLDNLNNIMEQIRQYEETGSSAIFGENSADLYETAKEVFNQATDLVNDYWDTIEDLYDNIMDCIDDIDERMERRREQYEQITEELEHQLDIEELLRGEQSYENLNKILAAQQNNYQAQLAEYQQQLQIWKDMQSSMEEGSEMWNEIQDKITDATSEINDLIQDSLENLQEQYSNAISKITSSWTDQLFTREDGSYMDLEWMQTEWELINRNADYYLDDVNKAYNIQKLQSQYLELLDGSNDLAIQQKITAQMQQQLSYLRDKTNLSEYDVQYAQAQLEILQKQIALEEAQRNKSQMKLRRDSQGNYSYVYTANEDDISSAQSDLLDAQNNAYNLSKNQMQQTQADSLSALNDAKSMIDQIWNDANLTLEEKKARTQTIIDSLKEYLAATSEQLSTSETNIINDFIGMCEILTDENKTDLEDTYNEIINGNNDAFDQIDTRWQTSLTTWLQNLDQFNTDTDNMFNSLVNAAKDFQKGIDSVGELVGQDFNDLDATINKCVNSTKSLASSTTDFIKQLKEDAGVVQDYTEIMNQYIAKIQDADNSMKAYQQQVNDLGNKLTSKEQENANLQKQNQALQGEIDKYTQSNSNNNSNSNSNSGNKNTPDSSTAWGIAQAIWTYGAQSGWGNNPIRSTKLTKGYGADFARQVQSIINQNYRSGKLVNYDSMKYSSYNLLGYDTGGYTGNWYDNTIDNKNGKLAFLHQKELVLNATDTENILAAVKAVRDFADSTKLAGLSQMLNQFSNAIDKTALNMNAQDIQQEVHITAEFPNANSAADIESALLSLNERAVQYSYSIG